jgi:hypothetical protein
MDRLLQSERLGPLSYQATGSPMPSELSASPLRQHEKCHHRCLPAVQISIFQPTKIELCINVKTAKTLGLAFPLRCSTVLTSSLNEASTAASRARR